MSHYENIKLEKEMYGVPGKSFTQVLESMDNSDSYKGTELEGMDAYQRQLKRFDIKVSGKTSDTVEKFFQSSASAALFPEYVARAVASGMNEENPLTDVVATVTKIDAPDYRPIDTGDGTFELEEVGEMQELPKSVIKSAKNLVSLNKRGRILETSYEALRYQRLDLFTVTLRQIGAAIASSQLKDAVEALVNGDGNVSGVVFDELIGELAYADFVKMWGELSPYKLTTILAGTEALQKIVQLDEFKDSVAGQDFHGTGNLATPLGAKLIHVPSMESGKIIGLDKNCALEMVQAGDIITDYDKLIDRQLERAAITSVTGFARLYANAAKGIDFGE